MGVNIGNLNANIFYHWNLKRRYVIMNQPVGTGIWEYAEGEV